MKHRILAVALGCASALVASALAPAQAAPASYVALGDSYASGTGTGSYLDDGTSCQRSTRAYPSLIAAARGYALNFRACSGATIATVSSSQLSALSASTSYVSLSVGGNDAGFVDVLTACAQPGWMSDCDGAIDSAQSFINNTLPGRLSTLYAGVRSAAPNAKVVIVGYPRVFMGEDCNAFTWFSPAEQARLNQTADLLNAKFSAQAEANGFSFANPTSRFIGHAVCDEPEWLNGLSFPISESFHPNRLGHAEGFTPLVSPVLTGVSLRASTRVLARADAAGPAQARLQRHYAEADRGVESEQFRIPDLTTPRAKAAAKRAGISIERWLERASAER